MQDLKQLVVTLNFINEKVLKHLPVSCSVIPQFIINYTVIYFVDEKDLSIKTLSHELEWSAGGIRKHVRDLSNSNWLEIKNSKNDKRVKCVKPTKKLLTALKKLNSDIGPGIGNDSCIQSRQDSYSRKI